MLCNSVVPPDPVTEITLLNITSTTLSLVLNFGFNGYGILTELSFTYNATSNQEYDQNELEMFPENGTGTIPSRIDITGLQPFTTYQFLVTVSNQAGRSAPTTINATTLPLRE